MADMKINVTPQITGLDDMITQLRRTGESLIAAADSLQRLSDGSPDSSVPCPRAESGEEHDAHSWHAKDAFYPYVQTITLECPGAPVRPWHTDAEIMSPDPL